MTLPLVVVELLHPVLESQSQRQRQRQHHYRHCHQLHHAKLSTSSSSSSRKRPRLSSPVSSSSWSSLPSRCVTYSDRPPPSLNSQNVTTIITTTTTTTARRESRGITMTRRPQHRSCYQRRRRRRRRRHERSSLVMIENFGTTTMVKIANFVTTTMVVCVFLFFFVSSSSSLDSAAASFAFAFPMNHPTTTSSRMVALSRSSPQLPHPPPPPPPPQSSATRAYPSNFQQSHLTTFFSDRQPSSSSSSPSPSWRPLWRLSAAASSTTVVSETTVTTTTTEDEDEKRTLALSLLLLSGDETHSQLKSTYTVKELKDLIKSQIKDKTDRPSSLSTMKKDDIIRWIVDNRSKMTTTATATTTATPIQQNEQPDGNGQVSESESNIAARLDGSDVNDMTTAAPTSRPRNGKMPPRQQQMPPKRARTPPAAAAAADGGGGGDNTTDSTSATSADSAASSSTTTTTTKSRSPRELGLHELYETYPPLRPKIRLTLKEIIDKKKKKKKNKNKNKNMKKTTTSSSLSSTNDTSSNDDTDDDTDDVIDDDVDVEDDEDEGVIIEGLDDVIMTGSEGDEDEEWMTTSFMGLGELDFRQHYHPMMRSLQDELQQQSSTASSSSSSPLSSPIEASGSDTTSRSDEDDDSISSSFPSSSSLSRQRSTSLLSGEMDLIFVGTASCTPGTTRGVSCTALRLNHQHSNFPSGAAAAAKKKMTKTTHADARDVGRGRPSEQTLGTWIFDVGESTQLQIQRTSSVRPSKITKIFITHAHGDHSFGLPGLLCLMGADRPGGANGNMDDVNDNNNDVVDIYGPEGLRMWLRVAIRYSVSRICPKYRVHELKDVPMAPEWKYFPRAQRYIYRGFNGKNPDERQWSDPKEAFSYSNDHWLRRYDGINLPPSERYGEIEGGKDIYPQYDHPMSSDGAPVWEVEGFDRDDDPIKVYAAPMSHGIPCVGYSIHEMDRPGRLKDEFVRPIVDKNLEGLKAAGFQHPLKSMAIIKTMQPGETFKFPDGTVLSHEQAVEPSRPGRRVVILGDTCSARTMEKLAANADVVIHEATNTYLYGLDAPTATLRDTTRDAVVHGHSTPHIAGLFARQVNAHRLILNHFSARYKGDCSLESMTIMNRIEQQAVQKSGLGKDRVAAAWDFMIFPIPLQKGNV